MSFQNTSCTVSGSLEGNNLIATINGHRQTAVVVEGVTTISLFTSNGTFEFTAKVADLGEEVDHDDGSGFKAPMNGTVVDILVMKGETVSAGDTLVIMEAMKMEHAIKAPVDGLISEIFYSKGDLVDGGADLLAFEPLPLANDQN
jgi:3-methylcrotonyl-CoA carboxylase alpha subunit